MELVLQAFSNTLKRWRKDGHCQKLIEPRGVKTIDLGGPLVQGPYHGSLSVDGAGWLVHHEHLYMCLPLGTVKLVGVPWCAWPKCLHWDVPAL